MPKIAVTGAAGLLGTHMCIFLSTLEDVEVVPIDRETFTNGLAGALDGTDIIFHFAGINRGSDEEISDGNPQLTQTLTDALIKTDTTPHVLFSSSIQENSTNIYGRSKAAARDILAQWGKKTDGNFTNIVLPHIFGEGGRPNYNSVIQTFCHLLANNKAPTIDNDGEIEPIHAQRACEQIANLALAKRQKMAKPKYQSHRITGRTMRVSEMLDRLQKMADLYAQNIIPDLRDEFDLDLFNTYRSYLYPAKYPVKLTKHSDTRGWLVETVKEHNGGQVFFSTTRPGITRGNHFHRHKVERFLVVSGQADICIRKIGQNHVETFAVTGDEPSFVDIPTLETHSITNTGNTELLTLFWVHEIFDPEHPDTYFIDVKPSD